MTPLILILGSGCVWTFVHSFSIKSYGVSPWTTNRVSSGFGKALVVAPNVQHLSMISFDDIGVMIYDSQLSLSNALSGLTQPSPGSFTLLFGAGLLSSLSPCSLSLLPLTTLYIVGSTPEKVNESDRMFKSLAYTTGLATTLTVFGLSASLLGDMFGQSGSLGDLSTFFTGFISIVMGLYLLELLYFEFPTFDGLFKNTSTTSRESLSDFSQAFLVGATTALIASPCSSPVLASLLTIVAKLGDPFVGSFFLFAFSIGFAAPVVAVATGALTIASSAASKFEWVNPVFAAVLISYGTFQFLDATF